MIEGGIYITKSLFNVEALRKIGKKKDKDDYGWSNTEIDPENQDKPNVKEAPKDLKYPNELNNLIHIWESFKYSMDTYIEKQKRVK